MRRMTAVGSFVLATLLVTPLFAFALTDAEFQAYVDSINKAAAERQNTQTVAPAPSPKPMTPPRTSDVQPTRSNIGTVGPRSLSLGMRGDDVAALQRSLITKGFLASGNDTGYFGPLTRAAVQSFQRTNSIVSTGDENSTGYGTIGPKTRKALEGGAVASTQPAPIGASGEMSVADLIETLLAQVALLQQKITELQRQASSTVLTNNTNPSTFLGASTVSMATTTVVGTTTPFISPPLPPPPPPLATSTPRVVQDVDYSPVPSRIIFEEHFGARLGGDRWMVEGQSSHTQPVALGNGDYALKITGDAKYESGLRTLWPFERGGNLTATFKLWHDGIFDFTTVSGPWLSTPSAHTYKDSYPFLHQIEAGLTGQENGRAGKTHIQWGEGSALWGWQSFDSDFMEAWFAANVKTNALYVRVQLGDTSGARIAWSQDGVTFYGIKDAQGKPINTVGRALGTATSDSTNNKVSSSALVWLGFGGGYKASVYIDDVVVRRDQTPVDRGPGLNPQTSMPQSAPAPTGWTYTDTIPDTLDLAERLGLAANGLLNSAISCPSGSPWYCPAGMYGAVDFGKNPLDLGTPMYAYSQKHARVLPLLRSASGNADRLNTEAAYLAYPLNVSWYNRAGVAAHPYMSNNESLTASALYNWFVRDSNPQWLSYARMIGDGLADSAKRAGDRAYYPYGNFNTKTGIWTATASVTGIPYTPPDEPPVDQVGNEGTIKWTQGVNLRALVRDWQEEENQSALSVAGLLKNFLLKSGLGDKDPRDPACSSDASDFSKYCADYSKITQWTGYVPKYPAAVYGTASGMSHGILTSLQSLLNYAVATSDAGLKTYTKNSLDHVIQSGIPKLGWLPYWYPSAGWGRPAEVSGYAETGALGDVAVLGVSLSRAGIADYWDYVDTVVRNSLSESQLVDMGKLRAVSGGASDADLARIRGRFSNIIYPTEASATIAGDGDANAATGLYYVWDAIMEYDNYTAKVNLALNKAARWGDVYSSLPYQGHIQYKNKWAQQVVIRVPGYVSSLSTVSVRVNGIVTTNFTWSGRYVVVSGLTPGTAVGVSFPIPEETWQFNWYDTPYTAKIRGTTVISVTRDGPAAPKVSWGATTFPLYTNGSVESYRTAPPQKTVIRFITDRRYPLQFEPYIGTYR